MFTEKKPYRLSVVQTNKIFFNIHKTDLPGSFPVPFKYTRVSKETKSEMCQKTRQNTVTEKKIKYEEDYMGLRRQKSKENITEHACGAVFVWRKFMRQKYVRGDVKSTIYACQVQYKYEHRGQWLSKFEFVFHIFVLLHIIYIMML